MARALVIPAPESGTEPPLALFAELARRGEELTMHGWLARAELPEVLDALRADRPDYLLLDASARRAAEAARELHIPAASYRSTCVAEREPLECCDLNLVFLAAPLQPNADRFDASWRFVGCLSGEDDGDADAWRHLGPHPVVSISTEGSGSDRDEFLRACTEAFAGLTFELVICDGHAPKAIPALLERTTLSISTAESATVEESVRAGVPQLLYPRSREQVHLAGQVEQLGAGLRLRAADLTGERIRYLAGRVMADPSYCRAAEGLRASFPPRRTAADICAELLKMLRRIACKRALH